MQQLQQGEVFNGKSYFFDLFGSLAGKNTIINRFA